MELLSPKPVGLLTREITITGCFIPWLNGQPTWLHITGSTAVYLPLFSKEEDLRTRMAEIGSPFDNIKHVEDGPEMLASLPYTLGGELLKVILDPWFTADGKVRWTEVLRTEA